MSDINHNTLSADNHSSLPLQRIIIVIMITGVKHEAVRQFGLSPFQTFGHLNNMSNISGMLIIL